MHNKLKTPVKPNIQKREGRVVLGQTFNRLVWLYSSLVGICVCMSGCVEYI